MEVPTPIRVCPAKRVQGEAAAALSLLRRPINALSVVLLAFVPSLLASVRFGSTPRLYFVVPLFLALAVVTVLDIRTKIIPDVVTLSAIAYALLAGTFFQVISFGGAALGALAGGGVVFLVAAISRGSVGGGDIKLAALVGAALGWKGVLTVLALSQLLAALIAVTLLVVRRAKTDEYFPVGAIISLCGIVMLLGTP
jgi:prepilin signal peptidase PulO-like enzyme (type II secretory pathway)